MTLGPYAFFESAFIQFEFSRAFLVQKYNIISKAFHTSTISLILLWKPYKYIK